MAAYIKPRPIMFTKSLSLSTTQTSWISLNSSSAPIPMTPNTPTHGPETARHEHRAHIFDSIFWQILPAHYDKIDKRWTLIARLHHEASSALMPTDRAAGVNSLKAELDMFEADIEAYRKEVKSVSLEDLVGLYMVAGRQRWRAEQTAKQDLEDLEDSLKMLEAKAKEARADVVYGFERLD